MVYSLCDRLLYLQSRIIYILKHMIRYLINMHFVHPSAVKVHKLTSLFEIARAITDHV